MKGIYMVDADMGFVQYFENLVFQNTTEYKVLGHSFKANDFLTKVHNKPELLKKIDLLFVNPKLNDMNGLELIKKVQGYRKDINICIIINENIKNFFMNDISELGIENIMIYPNEDDYFLTGILNIFNKAENSNIVSDMRQTIIDSSSDTITNNSAKHSEEEDNEILTYLTSEEFLSQFDFDSLTDEFLTNMHEDKDEKPKADVDNKNDTFDFKTFGKDNSIDNDKNILEEPYAKKSTFDFNKQSQPEEVLPSSDFNNEAISSDKGFDFNSKNVNTAFDFKSFATEDTSNEEKDKTDNSFEKDFSSKNTFDFEEQKISPTNDFVSEFISPKKEMPFNLDELDLSKTQKKTEDENNKSFDFSSNDNDIFGDNLNKESSKDDEKSSAYTKPSFNFMNESNDENPERGFNALGDSDNHHKGFGKSFFEEKENEEQPSSSEENNFSEEKKDTLDTNDIFSQFRKSEKPYENPFNKDDEIKPDEIKPDEDKPASDSLNKSSFEFNLVNPFKKEESENLTTNTEKNDSTDKFNFESNFPTAKGANDMFKSSVDDDLFDYKKSNNSQGTSSDFQKTDFSQAQPLDFQPNPSFETENKNKSPYNSYPPNNSSKDIEGNQKEIRDIYNNSGAKNLSFNPTMAGNPTEESYKYEKGGNIDSIPDFAKQIVAFYSVKGGIGKTSLAVNTTIQLAKYSKKKVCLIDFDLTNANVHTHLGILDSTYDLSVISNFEAEIDSYSVSKIVTKYKVKDKNQETVDFDVIVGFKEMTMLQRFTEKEVHKILTILEDMYDIVVVDTHPVYTDVAISTVLRKATKIIFIAEQEMTALNGAKDFILASKKYGIPQEKLFLVLNRYKPSTSIFTKARIEKSLGKEVMAVIPHDMDSLREAINTNNPVSIANPDNSLARSYIDVAKIIDKNIKVSEVSNKGLFGMFKK